MIIAADRGYDIIGDVHGCADALQLLLEQMGYQKTNGIWQHKTRIAVFLGDLLDRGSQIRQTLAIVRDMAEAGFAHCVMGNHEYYALAWHLPAPASSGQLFVREHNSRHAGLWQQTAEQFAAYPQEWQEYLDWFAQLPLFLEGDNFRVVHACWDSRLINLLKQEFGSGKVSRDFIRQSAMADSFSFLVMNRLLRGINVPLPDGMVLLGQDGLQRQSFRAKFWREQQEAKTFADLVFQPDPIPQKLAQQPLPKGFLEQFHQYDASQPNLFVGHYWRKGKPELILPNLACLDYSAVNGGKLVAYRYDQEQRLDANKFVWVAA